MVSVSNNIDLDLLFSAKRPQSEKVLIEIMEVLRKVTISDGAAVAVEWLDGRDSGGSSLLGSFSRGGSFTKLRLPSMTR